MQKTLQRNIPICSTNFMVSHPNYDSSPWQAPSSQWCVPPQWWAFSGVGELSWVFMQNIVKNINKENLTIRLQHQLHVVFWVERVSHPSQLLPWWQHFVILIYKFNDESSCWSLTNYGEKMVLCTVPVSTHLVCNRMHLPSSLLLSMKHKCSFKILTSSWHSSLRKSKWSPIEFPKTPISYFLPSYFL